MSSVKKCFQKGDRVKFTLDMHITIENQEGIIIGPSKRFGNHYRVRLTPSLLIKNRAGEIMDGKWEDTIHMSRLDLNVIKTMKVRMKNDKKSFNVPIKKAKAHKHKRTRYKKS